MSSITPLKKCTKCGNEYPDTLEFFAVKRRRKDGSAALDAQCRSCYNDKKKAARERNPEPYKAIKQRYRMNHPDADKVYQQNNREKSAKRQAAYRKRHPERVRTQHKEYCRKYPDKIRKIDRDWYNNNRDRAIQYVKNKYARRKGASGTHTVAEIRELLEWQDYKCFYCGADLHNGHSEDHYIPLSSEIKDNSVHNIYLACKSCNSSKNDRLAWIFDQRCM